MQSLLSDREKLCQLLEQNPKLMQMLQVKSCVEVVTSNFRPAGSFIMLSLITPAFGHPEDRTDCMCTVYSQTVMPVDLRFSFLALLTGSHRPVVAATRGAIVSEI